MAFSSDLFSKSLKLKKKYRTLGPELVGSRSVTMVELRTALPHSGIPLSQRKEFFSFFHPEYALLSRNHWPVPR